MCSSVTGSVIIRAQKLERSMTNFVSKKENDLKEIYKILRCYGGACAFLPKTLKTKLFSKYTLKVQPSRVIGFKNFFSRWFFESVILKISSFKLRITRFFPFWDRFDFNVISWIFSSWWHWKNKIINKNLGKAYTGTNTKNLEAKYMLIDISALGWQAQKTILE